MTEPFKLEANAKGTDGSIRPFTISVSKPRDEDGVAFVYLLDCPLLGFQQNKVFGAYADQSMALALWMVEGQLNHHGYEPVGDEGDPIELPTFSDALVPDKP